MASLKRSTWIQIRKDLYSQVRAQVEKRLGRQKSIENYEQDYAAEFKRSWKVSNPESLFKTLNESDFVFLADFHALYQSQKSHLRILNGMKIHKHCCLAMECFYSEDQKWVDRFIEGKVSEKEFLKAIEWSKKWGFPWDHYRKILHWAQKNKIKVIALNKITGTTSGKVLHERDKFAASLLADLVKHNHKSQIIVIYGDLHMAQNHLPHQLEKKISKKLVISRVFQNSEKVYFQLAKRFLENQVDVVRINKNTFCLNSVPPWVKWQNYLLFLERNEGLDDGEFEVDLGDQVSQYVKLMSTELDIKVDLNPLSVFTAAEESLWTQLESCKDAKSLRGYKLFIENEISFYAPDLQVAFLARMSVNSAATLAMHFLHSQTARVKSWSFRGPEDLERLIWVFGFGYLGSKLINPKRKSDTLSDIKAALSSKSSSEYGKEALRLALSQKMNELMFMAHRRKNRLTLDPRPKASYLVAAQLLGGLLGERLYNGYREGDLSLLTLKNLMQKDWSRDDFSQTYLEVMDMIEALPLAFKSKKDKL